MTKVTYNNEGIEEGGGGGSVQPKPGVYVAKIVRAEVRTEKSDGSPANDLHLVFDIGSNYVWLHSYVGLGAGSEWKLAELTRALGLREKGSFDSDTLKGKIIKIKVNPDTYEGNYQGKAGRFMKANKSDKILPHEDDPVAGGSDADDADDTDTDADTGDEREFWDGASREIDENGEPDEEVGSYDDWSDEDLEAEVNDRGCDDLMPGGRGKKRDKHIKALRAEDELFYAGDDQGDDSDDDGEEPEDDYDNMSLEDLIAEAKSREITLPRGRKTEQQVIDLLREDDGTDPFES